MRSRLTNGHPKDPVAVYVGRLGHEKNLKFLKAVMERVPGLRLAFVGDGPARKDLEAHFAGARSSLFIVSYRNVVVIDFVHAYREDCTNMQHEASRHANSLAVHLPLFSYVSLYAFQDLLRSLSIHP